MGSFRPFRLVVVLPFLLAGCDALFSPGGPDAPGGPAHVLGLVEVTLTAESSSGKAGEAHTPTAVFDLGPGPASGLQLQFLSNGSFTDGTRGKGGVRYLWASFRVRNATSGGDPYRDERRNVTFLGVSTGTRETPVSQMQRFDGSPADPAVARTIVPTGHLFRDASGEVAPAGADVLQVLTEDEVAKIKDVPAGVTSIFPYGFVVRHATNPTSRTLPAGPASGQFDGVVTFAFKAPLQQSATADPFLVTLQFLVVEDTEVRVTQSLEEQGSAGTAEVEARADALRAAGLTLLPGGGAAAGSAALRLVCTVRTAGTAGAPTAFMFPPESAGPAALLPDPYAAGPRFVGPGTDFHAARCEPFGTPTAQNFVVHGSQSGRRFGLPDASPAYTGGGSTIVHTPAAFFRPGEEVEVTLTSAVGADPAVVARYRVASAPASARFIRSTVALLQNPASSAGGPRAVVTADFDLDGNLDFATLYARPDLSGAPSEVLEARLGDGGGGFPRIITRLLPAPATALAAGDLNGDGHPDLVAAFSSGDAHLRVFLHSASRGDGVFTEPAASALTFGARPTALTLGDFNRDGRLDLAAALGGANQVAVRFGDGTGRFTGVDAFPVGSSPQDVDAGDFNRDGRLDLAVANVGSNNVSILLGTSTGSFSVAAGSPVAAGPAPGSLDIGDLDGDGALDFVTASRGGQTISVLLGTGTGRFDATIATVVGVGVFTVGLHDLNGDGRLDVTATRFVSGDFGLARLAVLLGDGTGGFRSADEFGTGREPVDHAAGDFDRDGQIDLVTANARDGNVNLFASDAP